MKTKPKGYFHLTQFGGSVCSLTESKQKALADKVTRKSIHLRCNYTSFSEPIKVLRSLQKAGAKALSIEMGICPRCRGEL